MLHRAIWRSPDAAAVPFRTIYWIDLVPFTIPDLSRLAILLDVDGTLLDIAPTPREVRVPDGLSRLLLDLAQRCDGALALVSGRPISELDVIFDPLRLPAVGGHGAEIRFSADGAVMAGRVPPLDPVFKQRLEDVAGEFPGVLVEDKGYGVALHFRLALERGPAIVHAVRQLFRVWADSSLELLSGKAVLEVKFAGFNKGTGVRELMRRSPFAGRTPLFIGDDRTDEDAFSVMPDFKGVAISVGRSLPGVDHTLGSPAEVRAWLEGLLRLAAAES